MADNTDDLIISISTDQATLRRSIKRIEQDLSGLAGSVKKQFEGVGKSIDNSVTSTMQNRINGMVGIGTKAAKEWTGALASQGKELERLRAQYSPLFATINNYKTAVTDIRRAHAIGAISATEMATAISKERQAALASTAAIKGRNAALADTPVQRGGGSFATSNIAAQFQDIGVTAAMGMSPLQVALQQGTQLSAVFNDLKRDGQGVGSALATAFASVISPVSLVTIGVVAASVAAIQYFSSVVSGSSDASEKLKEQAQLIQAVAEKWGDAVPALREYANELQRAQDAADLQTGVSLINEKTLEGVKKQLDESRMSIAALVQDLRAAGEEDEVIKRLQAAFKEFTTSADAGKLKTEEVKSVQDALAAAISSTGIPALSDFKKMFDEVSSSALSASENVGKVNDAASRMLPKSTWRSYNPNTGNLETNAPSWGDNIQNPGFTLPENGPVPASRPLRELEALPEEKKAETAAEKLRNAYRDLMKSADDRLGQLQQEIDLTGQFGIAAETARFKLDLLQESEDKGRSLSEEQRAELEKKVALYKQYSETLAKAKLSQDLLEDARMAGMSRRDQQVASALKQYGLPSDLNSSEAGAIRNRVNQDELADGIKSFASEFSTGLISEGKSLGEAFGDAVKNAAANAMQKSLDSLFSQISNALAQAVFGGGGGGAAGGGAVASVAGAAFGTAPVGAVTRSALPDIGAYAKAIQSIESGGNYGALGPVTRNGDRAYGAYQVMGNNIGPWSKEALGQTMSAEEFLRNPAAQDKIFNNKFGGYVDNFGPAGASQAWFGGPGSVGKGGRSDVLGTTVSEYSDKFTKALGGASEKVGEFGNGLGNLGNALSQFPSAPAAGGGGGGGSWFSSLFGGGLSGALSASPQFASAWAKGGIGLYADGGDVNGPGSGTSDSIPTMLSNGEFVIKASQSRKHRALLHAINNGTIGHMASGGVVTPRMIGAPVAPALASRRAAGNDNATPGVLQVQIHGASGDEHIRMLVKQGVGDGLNQYNQNQTRTGFGQTQSQYNSRKG